ncbi:porin [Chondromyces crocatus]|uniref:Porin n=1 Tax=Chondromyces crocatus TaxID=52 RepID=A0A0K1E6Z8_CHOCO|nr:porin [Chondromyces crocatus]AKT36619.1 uncharacterized protein CMC5_007390 [Chondromyces crocatus]
MAGWKDVFFIRSSNDLFRLYPMARLHLDMHSSFGPGLGERSGFRDETAPQVSFFARRIRLELGGDLLRRLSFMLGVDFGGQPLLNNDGSMSSGLARPGEDPTLAPPSWAPFQATGPVAVLANNWINYRALPFLNFMVGQFMAPYSLENMTSSNDTLFMERVLPIRAFIFPHHREIGLMAWGELPNRLAVYHVGIFSGDGPNRPGVDSLPAVIGRIYCRPFATTSEHLLARAQIGVSAMYAARDQARVGTDYPRISTGQFTTIWEPRYQDASGQTMRVIPSGAQRAVGGELWLPLRQFDFRSEVHYVDNHTREATEGAQLSNTERLGQLRGVGWYAALSLWLGDAQINGEPGLGSRPIQLAADQDASPRTALQLTGVVGGVHATYEGASRGGIPTLRSSMHGDGTQEAIDVMQYGVAATYWHTRHLRLMANYNIYQSPRGGTVSAVDQASSRPPSNSEQGAHLAHELGGRVAVQF